MISLTREVRFSVDRDWAGRVDLDRPISNSWGGWPSAVGLVPYLILRATVVGTPDPRTGYLCNIKRIDELLRRHAIPHAAEQLQRFGWRMPAERLLTEVWGAVSANAPPEAPLVRLELLPTPTLRYARTRENPAMVTLTQQFEFSAAHRLHCPELSEAENRATFGKCNNPNGHGHNYIMEVTVSGRPDSQTQVLIPLPRLETLVRELVVDVLDHTHLNQDTAQFRTVNPSVENIARVIWGMLDGRLSPATLANVRVYETPKTWADYAGESRD